MRDLKLPAAVSEEWKSADKERINTASVEANGGNRLIVRHNLEGHDAYLFGAYSRTG